MIQETDCKFNTFKLNPQEVENNNYFSEFPLTVNLHITERCNYQCKFCFAHYQNSDEELDYHKWVQIIDGIRKKGCMKVNFAGGEPTMISFLPDLINHAKKSGFFVSVISNGTGITEGFLKRCNENLDLLGLSLDSQFNSVELKLGRSFCIKGYSHPRMILEKSILAKEYSIPIKINSVVTSLNWKEDMVDFVDKLNPIRWKVFQCHYINGINDLFYHTVGKVSSEQFSKFVEINQHPTMQVESSEMITDSYLMISPDGRFYQDTLNKHNYSQKILDIGINSAFSQIQFSYKKFFERNGDYFSQNRRFD